MIEEEKMRQRGGEGEGERGTKKEDRVGEIGGGERRRGEKERKKEKDRERENEKEEKSDRQIG